MEQQKLEINLIPDENLFACRDDCANKIRLDRKGNCFHFPFSYLVMKFLSFAMNFMPINFHLVEKVFLLLWVRGNNESEEKF